MNPLWFDRVAVPVPAAGARDGDGMPVMRIVPAGTFLLGTTPDDPDAAPYERPQKRIDIPASYAIGVYPVLYGEYMPLSATVASAQATPPAKQGWFGRLTGASAPVAAVAARVPQPNDAPIVNVSFNEAKAFAEKLSALAQQAYRIPSEAEWEFACRAGTTSRYSSGDSIDATVAAFGLASGPVPVGAYAANNFGIYDMHGNVREWTADLWHDAFDLTPSDARPALDGYSSMRVVRGGGWSDSAAILRSAARMRATQSLRANVIGFRVARSIV